ncbi:hypothetical protein GOPIP_104_00420 [Gordonia polyisoprenivorans NBRC 16320 = JCM 10675]|uniref:Lipoprotein n=2 Tax=Gordonia TaxID=2053 RepID=A0A846WUZ2_9ACTN|nr:hypothetical protein [Gordonia polyisoprenivorans]NKY04877.1 hypothetical protein [Gordonia polyisoprenivorans]OZC30797.1 hypothetical protein CJJ17_04505 [Gordonia polyisoprenivorans]GAB26501.1 hypothetical protein GOPIP_104_00420 [Gordonia polyisoprenivorans NBRC 16320 = JCM 10675]
MLRDNRSQSPGMPVSRRGLLAAVGLGAGAAAIAGCATTPDTSGSEVTAAATARSTPSTSPGAPLVMIVRHAEKPAADTHGVTESGARDSASLTVTGWTRAGGLVALFGADGQPPREGLVTPDRIVASAGGGGASRRPLQTITPLAARLGVEPVTRFTQDDLSGAAAFVRGQTGVTLISWEHHRIRGLIQEFGKVTPSPRDWPDDRFDMVWLLRPSETGWALDEMAQLLLHGDRTV